MESNELFSLGSIDILEGSALFERLTLAFSWKSISPEYQPDLDISVFMLNSQGKIPNEEYFIFYNQLESPNGAILHLGDVRSANTSEDKQVGIERIEVKLSEVSPRIHSIVVVASIYEKSLQSHSFGMLDSWRIDLLNKEGNALYFHEEFPTTDVTYTDRELLLFTKTPQGWTLELCSFTANFGLQGFIDTYV